MNFSKFYRMMVHHPQQDSVEWLLFLEFIRAYFRDRLVIKPLILEIGTKKCRQKQFYTDFLRYDHIGVDKSPKYKTDVTGHSHDPETLTKVLDLANGREINLVFIDASHRYEDVKRDWEIYGPLATDMVAFHDIKTWHEYDDVRKLWKEIKADPGNYSIIEIFTNRFSIQKPKDMGIGILVKWGDKCINLPY